MRYGLSLVTAPLIQLVSTAEAKTHCRIDSNTDDTYIDTLINAARLHAENYTRRSFVNTVWDLTLDYYPSIIMPPRSPLVSVASITYLDGNGDSQTLATTEYSVDAKSEPGRVYLAYGKTWPTTRAIENAVTVRFTAGYGTAATSVPQNIRHAILLLVGEFYENRENTVIGAITAQLPFAVEALLAGERLIEA